MLYSHGNATDIGGMFSAYAELAHLCNINVIAYDYTGYGSSLNSGNLTTEKQVYKDIESIYDWIIESGIVQNPSLELVLYGQSVGSGPTCYIASKRPIAGVILQSGILSGIRVLTSSRLLCCFDIFPNIDRIRNVQCPVFIIHGEVSNASLYK